LFIDYEQVILLLDKLLICKKCLTIFVICEFQLQILTIFKDGGRELGTKYNFTRCTKEKEIDNKKKD